MAAPRVTPNDLTPAVAKYVGTPGPAIVTDASKKFLKFLKLFDHHDEFYTLTDLGAGYTSWSQGIVKWLGYPDVEDGSNVPLDYIAQYVPGHLRDWYEAFTNAALLAFMQQETHYLATRFVIHVPLQKDDGPTILVKHMMMPFRFDDRQRIVILINSYTLFGSYQGEALQPGIFESQTELRGDLYQQIIARVAQACGRISRGRKLTRRYLAIIEAMRILREEGRPITHATIRHRHNDLKGKQLDIDSVRRYLDTIKTRLDKLLGWSDHWTAASKDTIRYISFFDQCGIIDVLQQS